ncbi:MAG: inositol monophosphatase family protein, partial [Solirubrobacterales bacterium]
MSVPSPRALCSELALALRAELVGDLGAHRGRDHVGGDGGRGEGGDVTFAIDERAEARMEEFLAERAPNVAFYSEDRGLVEPSGGAETVLVVDPIDGTRPALAG